MSRIYIISRESYIKARIIKIKTSEHLCIDEAIRLANNGLSPQLSSHSQTSDGYQMFIHENADGGLICRQIIDALSRLPHGNIVIERINC
ncbi:MAG TPA: hypothetical protein VMT12_06625 [Syntrophales bacterium]|nr:hypothetical protein [Syntrophales bacterium]